MDINSFFIGNAVPNIITDWSLLITPPPYVWKIRRNNVQKIALCGAFTIGGIVCITLFRHRGFSFNMLMHANKRSICIISIVRLVVILESYKTLSMDVTWVFIGPSAWTAVETSMGIMSGNSSFNLSSSQFTNNVKPVFPHSHLSLNSSIGALAARGLVIETRISYLSGTEDHSHRQRVFTALTMIVIWLV